MADKPNSVQPRTTNVKDITSWLWSVWEEYSDIPAWGDHGRPAKLREAAQNEPILAGALASLVSKAVSLDWQITGGRNRVLRYQDVLAEAEGGAGWSYFLDRWLQDYLVTDTDGDDDLACPECGMVAATDGMIADQVATVKQTFAALLELSRPTQTFHDILWLTDSTE